MADPIRSPYTDEDRDPYEADDTKNPYEEAQGTLDEALEDDEEEAPKKRGPGRPRKNPA